MWMVMKAFVWESVKFEGYDFIEIASGYLGDKFIPVFKDHEAAKEFANKHNAKICEVEEGK